MEDANAVQVKTTELPLGELLGAGIKLYADNFGIVFLASLLAIVISVMSLGLLAGAMFGGLFLVLLRLVDQSDPRPQIGDLFKGFEFFVPAFVFMICYLVVSYVGQRILGVLPLGGLLAFIYAMALPGFVYFALPFIVDKRLEPVAAVKKSFEIVQQNFQGFLILAVAASIVGASGLILFGVGAVFTFPISMCVMAVTYRRVIATASSTQPTQ